MRHTKDSELIILEVPLMISKYDVQHGDWAQNKELWLNAFKDTVSNALDNEVMKHGWLKIKKRSS